MDLSYSRNLIVSLGDSFVPTSIDVHNDLIENRSYRCFEFMTFFSQDPILGAGHVEYYFLIRRTLDRYRNLIPTKIVITLNNGEYVLQREHTGDDRAQKEQ